MIVKTKNDIEPYRLTATQVIEKVKSGSFTVEQYARSLLARIEQRDAEVKAWAFLDPELVIRQAKQLDEIPHEKRGPLHGVAVGVKDVIYTQDMPTEHNSPIYSGHAPAVDAGSIMILRQAGALIFGKTTTTEFAATTVGGVTRNPHDANRTPGGSSSGSGAAVADLQVTVALGTQTGGSTVRPASFCGTFAAKPTWGAVSREGQRIYSPLLDTLGVYARCVEDLELFLGVLGVQDDGDDDDVEKEGPGPLSPGCGVKGAKFALVKTVVWPEAGPGTRAAMEKAAVLLRKHGAEVEDVELPGEFDDLPAWHRCVMATDGRATFLPEYRVQRGKLAEMLSGQVENAQEYSRADQLKAQDGIAALRPKIDEIAARYTAIIAPSVPDEAPETIEKTGSAAFNGMWTALHVPVVNLPGFKGANGMPIGLSLIAPRYQDRPLLRVCREVGKIFEAEGGWKSPL